MTGTVLGDVVLRQFFSYFTGRYPYNRVLASIEIVRKPEEVYADRALLESAALAGHRVLDNISEKLLAALAIAKGRAVQEPIEFSPHSTHTRLAESLAFNPFAHLLLWRMISQAF